MIQACSVKYRTVAFTRSALLSGMIGSMAMIGLAEAGEPVEEHIIPVYQRVAPATVLLSSAYVSDHPLDSPSGKGVGSGFIVDELGTVVTNAHVVLGASVITATLHDEQRLRAEVIGIDPESDVAVLRLQGLGGHVPTVRLGDSEHLRVGQRTLLVGSPLGLGFTLTTGIISRLGPLPLTGLSGVRLIQTTAPINPGNSGGPLLDSDGRVIGIATSVILGAQNIGFAIPINIVKDVITELKLKGRIVRPWLGISGQFLTEEIMMLLALPLTDGLMVVDVEEGSPAAEAGLRAGSLDVSVEGQRWVLGGDILVGLQRQSIRAPADFSRVSKELKVGQEIEIDFVRNGERNRTKTVVRERPPAVPRKGNALTGPAPSLMMPGRARVETQADYVRF
jgi:S1-C subfamily serine protease